MRIIDRSLLLSAVTVALVIELLPGGARSFAQEGWLPQDATIFDKEGTVAGVLPGGLQMITKYKAKWVIQIVPGQSDVKVTGTATPAFLHAGLFVKFTAELDDAGALKSEIKELEITTPLAKNPTGVFTAGAEVGARPVLKLVAGTYEFRAKVISYQLGELQVVAGRKFTAKIAGDAKIAVSVQDFSLAKPEDPLKVVGWFYKGYEPSPSKRKAGQALGKKIEITLAAPLTTAPQKGPVRPARVAPKSNQPVPVKLPLAPATKTEPTTTAETPAEKPTPNAPPTADPNDVFGFDKEDGK